MNKAKKFLDDWAENFQRKVPDDYSLIVQFDVRPGPVSWHVVVEPGGQINVGEGIHPDTHVILSATEETLRDIYEGKMTALTAAGRAHISDFAPLDFSLGERVELTPALKAKLFLFIQSFFNRSTPERIPLGEEHARKVHGALAIPMYYHPGFRSAWYLVKKGERLNEPGDTNPFPQAFIFISGEGYAKIGEETVPVRAGEARYIPPGSDHVVWTDSDRPLELIFLAWGEGA